MSFDTSAAPTVFGPMLFAGRVPEAIRVAAELGYQGIEISLRSAQELDWDRLREALEQHGLALSALGSGRIFLEDGLSFSDPDAAVRHAAVTRVGGLIDVAAGFCALVIIGLVRGARPSSGDGSRGRAWIAECLGECADRAGAAGIGLVVEAINRYETVFCNTAAETLELLDHVGRGNVGLLLDVFHMNIEEASIAAAIRAAGERLHYFHIVDSNRWAPGFGHVDYGEIMAALQAVGYAGWVSAEILPRPDDYAAARQARAFVAELGGG
ncbi:MAG: sugar phosphate isomerase/epimerase [Thermoleophilia bacterium]|nr:sugar phosphate isomerase/epimerase [Thermoleophilia bacterium]